MKEVCKKVKKGIRRIFFYLYAHLLLCFGYDKKYIKGKWFYGRFHGIFSQGWEWLCKDFYGCRFLNVNRECRFPVSPFIRVIAPENIVFDSDDINNFQSFGCYFQALDGIEIGRGSYIGPNVGLISENHSVSNPDERGRGGGVRLGKNCWIGMNSVILPGVVLGDHTVVGAGSVVTKSFPEGFCVIVGNPAKKIKTINIDD